MQIWGSSSGSFLPSGIILDQGVSIKGCLARFIPRTAVVIKLNYKDGAHVHWKLARVFRIWNSRSAQH